MTTLLSQIEQQRRPPHVPWNEHEIRTLKQLWGRGYSARVIAGSLERSIHGVKHQVRRLGLVRNPTHRRFTPLRNRKLIPYAGAE